jgi:uncharacterized protein
VRVEVVYATARRQERVAVELAPGASAAEAAERSGLPARHPELAGGALRLGLGGREIPSQHPLGEGDRIEILRPLAADPRQARRLRARRAGRR